MTLKDVMKKAGRKIQENERKHDEFIEKMNKRKKKRQEKEKQRPQTPEKPKKKEMKQVEEQGKTIKQLYQEMDEKKGEGGFEKPEEVKKREEKPEMWKWPEVTRKVKSKRKIENTTSIQEIQGGPDQLLSIPGATKKKITPTWEPPDLEDVDKRYELIKPWAYARIKWNEDQERLIYNVLEPPLTPEEEEKLDRVNEILIDVLDVNLMKVTEKGNVKEYLDEKIEQVIKDYEISLTKSQYDKLLYYVYRNFLGLEKIEPLMHDPDLEDLSCDGVGIPIYVYHRRLGSLKTNLVYEDSDELDRFVTKLAQRTGKHISVADPLLQGALPGGSRVQATYAAGKEIAMKGSNFTIRKFMEEPLTIIDQMNFGTIPALMGAYLWLAIENRNSALVSGGTATGKTAALNSLSMFLPRDRKILSIEDTPEIRLPHEHWISKIATATGSRGEEKGEISMFDLIKSGLRERPDEIIVGEVRGEEAYNLFQGMASLRGNEKVMVINPEGKTEHIQIEKLKNKDLKGYKTLSINPETKKVKIKPIKACVEHEPRGKLYKIKTATGREVTVTGDHSVFVKEKGEVKEKQTTELEEGENLAVPAKAPTGYADKEYLNLAKELGDVRVKAPKYVKKASEKIGWRKAGDTAEVATISDYYGENTISALKAPQYFKLLEKAGITNDPAETEVKFERRSEKHPAKLEITPELLRLIGYYISEGSLNTARKNNTIQLYNSDEDVLKDMEKCIKTVTGKEPTRRKVGGYGDAIELAFNHKVIYEFLKQKCGHGSKEKRIPQFIFGLSKEKINELLSALWTGDGSCTRKNFQYSTSSEELADQVMHMLLQYGIVAHKYHREEKNIYQVEFYSREDQEKFQEHINPINKEINLTREKKPSGRIDKEVYGDPVKEIEEIKLEEPEPVYDLNIPGPQNFIGGSGGIMLHNTGHPGLSTIHADSVDAVINRLKTPPINLSPGLLQHLDLIMIMGFAKVEGMDVRRVRKVVEIVDIDLDTGRPITNELFTYIPSEDYFEFSSEESYILKEVKEEKGVTKESVWDEMQRRAAVLKWMQEKDITEFEEVGRIISRYHSDPEEVMKKVREEKVEE